MSQTIGMISLGCAKNQINAEQMLFLLRVAGYEILPDPDGADLVIINTCGFIEDAKTEAIDNILAMGELKKEGRVGKILVTGCLAQRYQMEIVQEMPEVDGVLGTGSYYDIVSAVGKVLSGETVAEFGDINANLPEPQRILTTPEHYAYLRIAEGCDNHCAFCIIPKLRGRYRSRPMEELVKEAQDLAESGVKELIVIAQDTSRYGIDLYGERKLAELLQKLCAIDGIVWVRIHYLYPDEMSDELIDVLADEPKIVKYLDIPIQHINDNILRAMNRRGNGEYVKELLKKLRVRIPGLVIRTSPRRAPRRRSWNTPTRRSRRSVRRSSASFSRASWTNIMLRARARSCRCSATATTPTRNAIMAEPTRIHRISTDASGSQHRGTSRRAIL